MPTASVTKLTIPTPHGPAMVHLHTAGDPRGALVEGELRGLPLITGGRSAGARVACRTARATGAAAVLCLAFPLQPPARKGKPPAPDRLHELEAVKVPVLVVQGENDRFGMPPPGRN